MALRIEGHLTFALSIVKEALIQGSTLCSNCTLQLGYILLTTALYSTGSSLPVCSYKEKLAAKGSHVHILCFAFVCLSSYFDKVSCQNA